MLISISLTLLLEYCWRYISTIYVYNARSSNDDRYNEYYVLQTMIDIIKENGLPPKDARKRQYPVGTMTDADYSDDLALLTNTPAQDKSLLRSQEQAARGICLYVNTNKTEFMCFKQGTTSILWQTFKISRQVRILWQQYLIY